MFCHKRAGIYRSKGLACRVRNYFLMDLKHSCNAAATASAQVDFVATVPKPKSARATSRQRASSSGEDELGIHLNFESSSSIPVATTSGTSPLRPWSFTDAPIGPKGTIFGWQTECPKSATYAAAGVIPFAYREDEQELYVLMSFQLSDRNPKTSLVYTFLGGKVAGGDKNNPCRTAAREAHEETHRVLDEQLVLNALLGKVPAYGSGSSVRKSVSPRDASAATAVPSPAPVTPASAAACDAIPIDAAANARADAAGNAAGAAATIGNTDATAADPTGCMRGHEAVCSSPAASSNSSSSSNSSNSSSATGTRATGETVGNGSSSSGRGRSEDSTNYSSGRGGVRGRYPVPSAYFPSGRYTAFAMHLPNAWHLPEICQKRIMDKQKHPQAKKAEGLAWVSLRQLALLRAGKDVKDDVSGRTGSGHHYVLMLMRAGGQPVGVFKWLQSLEAHLRHWHGLPETNDQQKQVTKAARGEGADSKMRAGASGSESGGGQEHDLGLVKPRVVLNTKAKVGKDAQQHQQRAFYTVWAIDGSSQQVLVKQAQPKPPLSLLRLESSAAPSAVAARVAPSGLAQPSALPASLQPPQQVAPSAAMTHQSDGDSVPVSSGAGNGAAWPLASAMPIHASAAGPQQPHGHPRSQPQEIPIPGPSVQQPQQQQLRQQQQQQGTSDVAAHEGTFDQGKPPSGSGFEATSTSLQPRQEVPSSTSWRPDRFPETRLLQEMPEPSQETNQSLPSPQELLPRPHQHQQGHQGYRQWQHPQQQQQQGPSQCQSRDAAGSPREPPGPLGSAEGVGGKPPAGGPQRDAAPAGGDAVSLAPAAAPPGGSSSSGQVAASPPSATSARVEEPGANTTVTAHVQQQPPLPPQERTPQEQQPLLQSHQQQQQHQHQQAQLPPQQRHQHPDSSDGAPADRPRHSVAYRKWYMDGRVETVVAEGLGNTKRTSVLAYQPPAQPLSPPA